MAGTRAPGAGRKRKPTALHIVQGTENVTRMTRDQGRGTEPEFVGTISRPEWLSESAAAHWDEMAPMLERAGVLKAGDVTALAVYCEEFATWKAMNSILADSGNCVDISERGTSVSGYLKARNIAYANIMKSLSLFGLTPADRSRVIGDVEGKKPVNRFAAIGKK